MPYAEVCRMTVSPRHRREGIASHLIRMLIAHARNHRVSTLFLHTIPVVMIPAIKMYEQFGWVQQREIHIRDGLITVVLIQFRLDLTDDDG